MLRQSGAPFASVQSFGQAYFFSPLPLPLSFFRHRTYCKGYYFYSPQSSTVIKYFFSPLPLPLPPFLLSPSHLPVLGKDARFQGRVEIVTLTVIFHCHKIKDGGYNNITNMNKVSPTQNTPALQAKQVWFYFIHGTTRPALCRNYHESSDCFQYPKKSLLNPFAPKPPVTACVDPHPFFRL